MLKFGMHCSPQQPLGTTRSGDATPGFVPQQARFANGVELEFETPPFESTPSPDNAVSRRKTMTSIHRQDAEGRDDVRGICRI